MSSHNFGNTLVVGSAFRRVFCPPIFKRIVTFNKNKMNNYSKLYWFTRLDHFSDFIIAVAVLLIIISATLLLRAYAFKDKSFSREDEKKEIDAERKVALKKSKVLIPVAFVIIMLTLFIPSKNEVIFIMAGGKTLDYVQSDTSLSKIPYKATEVIVNYLDKAIGEMKDKK